jgi:ribonucleotide monophosphatase NagD (HAD superfamily)
MAQTHCTTVDTSNVASFVDSTDTFIFDCDGVLWKTHSLLPGVAETMDMLRDMV